MKTQRGFTLIELMIVVAVIAILATVALSGYNKQVRKSRRAEAKQVLVDYSLRQERLRSNSTAYTNSESVLLNGGTAQTFAYYNIALATPTGNCNDAVPPAAPTAVAIGNSFKISAAAKNDQVKDSACTPLELESKCGQVVKTPVGCW